jgi:hypothetical protein
MGLASEICTRTLGGLGVAGSTAVGCGSGENTVPDIIHKITAAVIAKVNIQERDMAMGCLIG